MSERKKPYYIGVDIGVASCGVACCDENYNILKYNGKDCLVSRIFDRADDCKHRRALRGARRLVERRKKRIFLLQEIFRSEIYRKDPNFYERLEKSQLYCDHSANDNQNEKDKIERLGKYTLFNDEDYTDLDYHKDFPTIYHLRQALYDKNNLKHAKATGDIRLVYLACEHIIKKRGNFLIDDEMDINQHSIDISMKIKELNGVTEQMTELGDLSEKLSVSLELRDLENREIEKKDPKYWLINIIKNKRIGITILKQFGLVLDDPINFLEEG
ncbi:MAG: hypothetical protein LBB45_04445 [Methanobrevibacter sp.]|jgi:CRISPR-associated endonuclease Csn1|nr:hypothetical protein [Candidatus Methanovirga basalitermitum]